MTPAQIAQIIESKPKGGFATVIITRPVAMLKTATRAFVKVSRVQLQACDYAARKAVREAIANGSRSAPLTPKHVAEKFVVRNGACVTVSRRVEKSLEAPFFPVSGVEQPNDGEYIFWRGWEGQEYFPYNVNPKNEAAYYVDAATGDMVDKAIVQESALASEFRERAPREELQAKGQDIFNAPKIENVKEVH